MKKIFVVVCILSFGIGTYAQLDAKVQMSKFAITSNKTSDGNIVDSQTIPAIAPTIVIVAAVLLATTMTTAAGGDDGKKKKQLSGSLSMNEYKALQMSTLD